MVIAWDPGLAPLLPSLAPPLPSHTPVALFCAHAWPFRTRLPIMPTSLFCRHLPHLCRPRTPPLASHVTTPAHDTLFPVSAGLPAPRPRSHAPVALPYCCAAHPLPFCARAWPFRARVPMAPSSLFRCRLLHLRRPRTPPPPSHCLLSALDAAPRPSNSPPAPLTPPRAPPTPPHAAAAPSHALATPPLSATPHPTDAVSNAALRPSDASPRPSDALWRYTTPSLTFAHPTPPSSRSTARSQPPIPPFLRPVGRLAPRRAVVVSCRALSRDARHSQHPALFAPRALPSSHLMPRPAPPSTRPTAASHPLPPYVPPSSCPDPPSVGCTVPLSRCSHYRPLPRCFRTHHVGSRPRPLAHAPSSRPCHAIFLLRHVPRAPSDALLRRVAHYQLLPCALNPATPSSCASELSRAPSFSSLSRCRPLAPPRASSSPSSCAEVNLAPAALNLAPAALNFVPAALNFGTAALARPRVRAPTAIALARVALSCIRATVLSCCAACTTLFFPLFCPPPLLVSHRSGPHLHLLRSPTHRPLTLSCCRVEQLELVSPSRRAMRAPAPVIAPRHACHRHPMHPCSSTGCASCTPRSLATVNKIHCRAARRRADGDTAWTPEICSCVYVDDPRRLRAPPCRLHAGPHPLNPNSAVSHLAPQSRASPHSPRPAPRLVHDGSLLRHAALPRASAPLSRPQCRCLDLSTTVSTSALLSRDPCPRLTVTHPRPAITNPCAAVTHPRGTALWPVAPRCSDVALRARRACSGLRPPSCVHSFLPLDLSFRTRSPSVRQPSRPAPSRANRVNSRPLVLLPLSPTMSPPARCVAAPCALAMAPAARCVPCRRLRRLLTIPLAIW
ncbi:hypothetical protein DENSPDRAFT_886487 [Dentipellis sp. KUC8613]|nr:hypothetical protein DENSPDRAFT_886487 [Dentipellis sp. KUC8613]